MSPFLSYSGRGGSHRGRDRIRGRGRGRAGRGNSIDLRANNVNKHKWVRPPASTNTKHDIENNNHKKESTSKMISAKSSVPDTQAGTESKSDKEVEKSPPIPEHRIMKRNGQKTRSIASEFNASSKNEPQSRQPLTQSQTLTREGKNKLVSLTTSKTVKPIEQKYKKLMQSYSTDRKFKGLCGHQKMAPPLTISRPTAKRVKLSLQPCSTMKEGDTTARNKVQINTNSADQLLLSNSQTASIGVDTGSETKSASKLSDFAYREVSRIRQREMISGHSLKWSKKTNGDSSNDTHSDKTSLKLPMAIDNPKKRPKIKNMGLVRVQPDVKTTPICPIFLRGLHCQDQFCRKRHDIPKEYAMPVCSFFQRHGQCLKGESCIFRHVKLNANAQVCPCFAILGFCEDEQCTMQHVRGKAATATLGENETCILATANGSSRFRRRMSNNVYYRNRSTSGDRAKNTQS